MTADVFVDTNVLVYARDASEPEKQPAAARWLEQLWIEQRGRTSIQVLNEYYVTVTRNLRPGMEPDEAWRDVDALLAWEPQVIDAVLLRRARDLERRHDLGWRDATVVAAAQLQSCTLLLSDDLQDGWSCDGVTVRNPFTAGIADEAARYATTPAPKSRHRRPGRPQGGGGIRG